MSGKIGTPSGPVYRFHSFNLYWPKYPPKPGRLYVLVPIMKLQLLMSYRKRYLELKTNGKPAAMPQCDTSDCSSKS